jgi:hypothetical protein
MKGGETKVEVGEEVGKQWRGSDPYQAGQRRSGE